MEPVLPCHSYCLPDAAPLHASYGLRSVTSPRMTSQLFHSLLGLLTSSILDMSCLDNSPLPLSPAPWSLYCAEEVGRTDQTLTSLPDLCSSTACHSRSWQDKELLATAEVRPPLHRSSETILWKAFHFHLEWTWVELKVNFPVQTGHKRKMQHIRVKLNMYKGFCSYLLLITCRNKQCRFPPVPLPFFFNCSIKRKLRSSKGRNEAFLLWNGINIWTPGNTHSSILTVPISQPP